MSPRVLVRLGRVGMALGVAITVVAAVPGKADTIHWYEDSDASSLRFDVANNHAGYELNLRLTTKSNEHEWNSSRIDSLKNKYAEIKLAIPIKVRNDPGPQLLVKIYRPNWLDYEIYSTSMDSVDKTFSFSCRDDSAVKWVTSRGELTKFFTFDRFEVPPDSLAKQVHIGTRWELREEWEFSSESGSWVTRNKRWIKYKFGVPIGNAVISKPGDCKFLYRSQ